MIETFIMIDAAIKQCSNVGFKMELREFLDAKIQSEISQVRYDLGRARGHYRLGLAGYLKQLESLA